MHVRPDKPRKRDFVCEGGAGMGEFLRASAAWAEAYNQWPWTDEEDEDDQFVYDVLTSPASC